MVSNLENWVDITHVVPEPRLRPYRQVAGADAQRLEGFYLWCQSLASSLFNDIAALEVAMRSAMARELCSAFGTSWYESYELFDDDAMRSLASAWRQNGLERLRARGDVEPAVIEGKLVAGLMFGFWVQILGRGSHAGRHPFRQRRIYDTLLWRPALSKAFPFASSRSDTQRAAQVVRAARNRIAHHEHIAWGIPLAGQGLRLSVTEVHKTMLSLAGSISPETRLWIERRSSVADVLLRCPENPRLLQLRD
ncbi:hypothetical protein Q5424_10325 [Conexibacter sp. JD483]|uniref:hypothetical protein n=1 Tax=unclassified Conexibacter TaxID=2627773 RepID=UPI00271B5BE5|nr:MULTISPECIES: hypothetical protein [unclassified Conexibacter]MDO8189150.1 hypothetical protein [Conexibacter sp. CPCC 205706]MDO8200753.1 hypothetical protein [Conexibacter sp. CPCC 205762]MDR9369477.1 hypothetical protein [Conexibacter sp. JD483]